MITLQIPLPTYLYKYLMALYGPEYQPTMYDDLGILILNLLERKTAHDTTCLKKWKHRPVDKIFVIHLSLSQFERKGFFIFNEKIQHIQSFIDHHFRSAMYRNALLNYKNFNIPYKDSILSFLKSYDISEEDFPYESIRKDFNRKKDKMIIA